MHANATLRTFNLSNESCLLCSHMSSLASSELMDINNTLQGQSQARTHLFHSPPVSMLLVDTGAAEVSSSANWLIRLVLSWLEGGW
jgi:hypothetical protein